MIPDETPAPIDCQLVSGQRQRRLTLMLEVRDGVPYLIPDPDAEGGGLQLDPEQIAPKPGGESLGFYYKQPINFEIKALTERAQAQLGVFLHFYEQGHKGDSIREALKLCSLKWGSDPAKLKQCVKGKLGPPPATKTKARIR